VSSLFFTLGCGQVRRDYLVTFPSFSLQDREAELEERADGHESIDTQRERIMELEDLLDVHRIQIKNAEDRIAKLELDLNSSQTAECELLERVRIAEERATHHEGSLKEVTDRSLELEDALNTHQNLAKDAAEKVMSLEALVTVTRKSHAEVSAEALKLREKFQVMDLQLKEAEDRAAAVSQKGGDADEVMAELQLSVSKLKEAEAEAFKLQERLVAVHNRADAAESQYAAVVESLANTKEEVGNLQTWSAEVTLENQQLQSQVCLASPYLPMFTIIDQHSLLGK
jgi:chromosome segregation ATPase